MTDISKPDPQEIHALLEALELVRKRIRRRIDEVAPLAAAQLRNTGSDKDRQDRLRSWLIELSHKDQQLSDLCFEFEVLSRLEERCFGWPREETRDQSMHPLPRQPGNTRLGILRSLLAVRVRRREARAAACRAAIVAIVGSSGTPRR